jgi:predicted ArsR family transcriptional regulator
MAWKGTRPQDVVDRDKAVKAYLKDHRMASRNEIAAALDITPQLAYLSLFRLREAGEAKRCIDQETNETLWSAETGSPCP